MKNPIAPVVAALLLVLLSLARGEEREDRPTRAPGPDGGSTSVPLKNDITPQQVQAIERGLQYLATHQNRDGSFNENPNSNVAVTGLAVLAFMANGNNLSRGRHQEQVQSGIRYLLQSVRAEEVPGDLFRRGYIHREIDPQSRMHGHGYATMALALAYGSLDPASTSEREIRSYRQHLVSAIRCTEESQDDSGGWGYLPTPTMHEGSVTVTQVWALRAAQEAGFRVNRTVIDKAIRYLEASQDADTGGFCYSLDSRNQQTYALTAAAVSTLFGLGEYGRRGMIGRGIEYLKRRNPANYSRRPQWFYYGNFYAAQALWQAAATDWAGNYWREWWPRMRDHLVREQMSSNAWTHPSGGMAWGVGSAYATAMAVLILTVPLEILPIYQR